MMTSRELLRVRARPGGYISRDEKGEDSLIYTNVVEHVHIERAATVAACPTLFQQYINKRCDVRVTIIDQDVHAVQLFPGQLDPRQQCDIRRQNMDGVDYRCISLPANVLEQLLELTGSYALRFAAIDMAVTVDGEWVFFELNPNGQWAWLDLAGATRIADSFVNAFSRGN